MDKLHNNIKTNNKINTINNVNNTMISLSSESYIMSDKGDSYYRR